MLYFSLIHLIISFIQVKITNNDMHKIRPKLVPGRIVKKLYETLS